MTEFLPKAHPALGTLRLDEVFEYYDGPVLFTARDQLDRTFLAVAVSGVDGSTDYLYVPLSDRRATAVRTGLIDLRDAFARPEGDRAYIVRVSPGPGLPEVAEVAVQDIRTEWLPDAGEALTQVVETAPPFSTEGLARTATSENRYLIAIEIDQPPELLRTELPIRDSGTILTEFQELADAFANDSDFVLVGLQAASFVFVLSPMVGDGLFGVPSQSLEAIRSMLLSIADDGFDSYLASLNRRRRAHVRDFLNALSDADTGVKLISTSPTGQTTSAEVSKQQVRAGLVLLRASSDSDSEEIRVRGHLIALNHRRRTFGVRESEPTGQRKRARSFSGKLDASIDIEGIPSGETILYDFVILQETELADFDEASKVVKNRMLRLTRVDDDSTLLN